MKLFPYVLVRIGGLPLNTVADLSWENKESLNEFLLVQEVLENLRTDLLSDLLTIIEVIEDYPSKFYLKIIRRDIYNRRNFKIKPFDYDGKFKKDFVAIQDRLLQYKLNLNENKESSTTFKTLFDKEVSRTRNLLTRQSLPEALTKGLQLASYSLLKRLESYPQKAALSVNKKLLQTERKLLQYLSRISLKTSPFSSFTKLSVIDLEDATSFSAKRKVRLNNTLYRIFRDSLIHYPPFFEKLKIRLNSSLRKKDKEWIFLLNTRNIESIQKIESSDLIDFILEKLHSSQEAVSFFDFTKALLHEIDADFKAISDFVLQLINYGLIEWDWSFSGLDPQWHFKLNKMLVAYPNDELLQELRFTIEKTQEQMLVFEKGAIESRREAQRTSFELLKTISEKLLETTGLKGLEQSGTADHLKKFFSTAFEIPLEQIFYEDVSQTFESPYSDNEFAAIARELEKLTYYLSPLVFNVRQEELKQFFKENITSNKIDLLVFYESYFQNKLVNIDSEKVKMIKDRNAFVATLLEKGKFLNQMHFQLDWNHFPEPQQENLNIDQSKASLVHLFKKDGALKAFTDSIFMGYGKMFGRFLHLFPEKVEHAIRINNQKIQKNTIWMEAVDASIYNPNVHPALVSLEIQMPGSQNNLAKSKQVSINDLEICFDKKMDRLSLVHKTFEKEISVFNYGFEAIENRSPMYQLLTVFAYQSVGPDLLSSMLNEGLKKVDDQGIILKPRISVGKHLILQRKNWCIPKAIIPIKENAQDHASYFVALNKWRKNLAIPSKVFISINPMEFQNDSNKSKGDDYKPQYLDFESPLFVQLFSKLILRIPKYLKIEEMLPELELNDSKEVFVQEYLLEWESGV